MSFTLFLQKPNPGGLASYQRRQLYSQQQLPPQDFENHAGGEDFRLCCDAQDGLLGVLGIKVDPRDRSVGASELRGQSALFHFARSGKTLGKYVPEGLADTSSMIWSLPQKAMFC